MPLSLATVGAKITASFVNAIVTLVNRQGLTSVIPTSVAGASVTVSAGGTVTCAAATTASLNGVFDSGFENYKIIINLSQKSAATDLRARMRAAGTDDTVNYFSMRGVDSGTTRAIANGTGGAWFIDGASLAAQTDDIVIDLFGPALAIQTRGDLHATTYTARTDIGLYHTTASTFDGITIFVASGTITGTIRVYGYNNN